MGYNVCVIGSTPNEWIAAMELARAGRQVTLVKTSGGALATREFHPGFRGEVGLDSLRVAPSLVPGLQTLSRTGRTALYSDGGWTRLTRSGIEGRVSGDDPKAWEGFVRLMDDASQVLLAGLSEPLSLVSRWRELGARQGLEVLRVPWMPVRDLLDEWFSDQGLKGLLATAAVRGLNQGPFACGTAFRLINQWAEDEVFGGVTVPGGLAGYSEQLQNLASGLPISVLTGDITANVELDDEQIAGFTLADGRQIHSDFFLSGLDARTTFTRWLRPRQLETEWNQTLRHYRYNGCVARLLLAVKGLPRLQGLPGEYLGDTIVLQPGLTALEKTYDPSKYGRAAEEPWVELTVPSVSDPSLAPEGHHVVSLWMQYAPFSHSINLEEAGLALLRKFWPELDSQLLARHYYGPAELAAELGLTEGHLFGGEQTLDQSWWLRPTAGFAGLTPTFVNLDLCGAGSAPGGFQGWCGHQAVRRYLASGQA